MARRVVQYFAEPHKVLEMSEEAKQLFLAYQAGWNVQGALQHQKEEGSGRLGTAAWHLAVTAAANLVLEIGAGNVAVEAGAPQLRIESGHITRAYKQVSLSHSLVSIWTGKGPMVLKISCFHDSSLHSTH